MSNQNPQKVNLYTSTAFLSLLLVIVGIAAYINSFDGPFIFDDVPAIQENPHLQHLWPLTEAMSAPAESTVAGRPIASLSLALNYAIWGYSVWGYHALNLAIHLLAGLTVYAIVRRTLLTNRLSDRFANRAAFLAWSTAAIWLVHPIQTESVTYIIQRTESLMGLFYLLTLYAAMRAMQSKRHIVWSVISVACCGLGMATKEAMVTAPVLVLLYDRTFVAGSFVSALRRRLGLYTALAATWVILIALMWQSPRSTSTGFELEAVTAWGYAVSQFGVIVHYLRLCLWPTRLCLDYNWPVASGWNQIVPPMLLVVPLATVTIWALVRNRSWSYPCAWFFVILSPTSTFVPILDLAFEHRLYLPLAGLIVLLVTTAYILLERITKTLQSYTHSIIDPVIRRFAYKVGGFLVIAVVVILTGITIGRNKDYDSVISIWQKVLDVSPNNPRAHSNIAAELQSQGRLDEAIGHYRQALQIKPDYAGAHNDMGFVLQLQNRLNEAISHFKQALQIKPDFAEAYTNLGNTLSRQGKLDEAISCHRQALQIKPNYAKAHNNLGTILRSQGKLDEAVKHYLKALQVRPDFVEVHYNLGNILTSQGKLDAAVKYYRQALKIKPGYLQAHNNLANALRELGKPDEAINHYRRALQIWPDYVMSLNSLAQILIAHPNPKMRDPTGAIDLAERAAKLTDYRDAFVLNTLAATYAAAGRFNQAVPAAQKALKLASDANNDNLAEYIRRQLKLYRREKP